MSCAVNLICLSLLIAPLRTLQRKYLVGLKHGFLVFIFGYCPTLLHNILPQKYRQNFCKLISAVQLLQQHTIAASQVWHTHLLVLEFTEEYKALYYHQIISQLHFSQQSIHGLWHIAQDIAHRPGVYSFQWTLEHTIGNLGQEIKQLSNPYTNLANCDLQHSQLWALNAILPNLEPDVPGLPCGAADIGDGVKMRPIRKPLITEDTRGLQRRI